ncbi:MAG: hypothetical protein ACJAXS_001806 [Colwellia sp.]|jgi:hypothetical protein|tara:strand:- start:320 stop:550 length:231 start_codon:yes stop_codon:yes gene_type:complete
MILPNKFLSYDDSTLSKLPLVIKTIGGGIEISNLYKKLANKFLGIDEFILTLDLLFAINSIRIDFDTRIVKYVEAT